MRTASIKKTGTKWRKQQHTFEEKNSSTRLNRKTAAHLSKQKKKAQADDQMMELLNKIHLLLGRQHSVNCNLIYTKTLQCKMSREKCSALNKRYDSILCLAQQPAKT